MSWSRIQLEGVSQLDNPACVHDADDIAEVVDNAHVMGYEQVCEIELLLEGNQQLEYL
jgi:hypothetical protein